MRQPLLVVAVLATVSCGGDGSKAVPAVTPTPTPTPTVTLSGTVRETAPTQSTPIAGATVTIITGPFVGKSATTDANGGFQLGLSPGDVNIVVRAVNYGELYDSVAVGENRATATFELDPVAQTLTSTLNGTINGSQTCPGYWDGFLPSDPCKADYVINVHHEGTLTSELTSFDPNTEPPFVQLYRANNGQPSSSIAVAVGANTPGQPISVPVEAHSQYVLQVRIFSSGGGPPPARVTSHSLTVKHPS